MGLGCRSVKRLVNAELRTVPCCLRDLGCLTGHWQDVYEPGSGLGIMFDWPIVKIRSPGTPKATTKRREATVDPASGTLGAPCLGSAPPVSVCSHVHFCICVQINPSTNCLPDTLGVRSQVSEHLITASRAHDQGLKHDTDGRVEGDCSTIAWGLMSRNLNVSVLRPCHGADRSSTDGPVHATSSLSLSVNALSLESRRCPLQLLERQQHRCAVKLYLWDSILER